MSNHLPGLIAVLAIGATPKVLLGVFAIPEFLPGAVVAAAVDLVGQTVGVSEDEKCIAGDEVSGRDGTAVAFQPGRVGLGIGGGPLGLLQVPAHVSSPPRIEGRLP